MTDSLGKGLDLAQLAVDFLAAVESHFASADVDLPERRIVVAGNPALVAWDCDQLTVGLSGIGWGQAPDLAATSVKPGAQISAVGLRHAILSVQLVRCTPSAGTGRGNVTPNADQIHEAGLAFFKDAGLLSQAVMRYTSRLRQQVDKNSGMIQAGAVQPLGPEGKYHANECSIAITAGNLL